MTLLSSLLDLLFPPKCPFCGRVLDTSGICDACRRELPWTEGDEALRRLSGGLRCAAPLRYEGLAKAGLHRFKFQGMSSAAGPLGELVARCAAEQLSGESDTVTWVPVSAKRLRQRGYDQARLLAERACALWDTAPVRLLDKTVHNPAQSGLKEGSARRDNVRGVYRAADPDGTRGRRILLVDDICTTGATLAECARVLREAGAADVVCAAAALTPLRAEKAAPDAKKG